MSNSIKTNVAGQLPSMMEFFWDCDLSDRCREMQPSVNVRDLPNKYELKIAAPGFKKKNFNIEVDHGQMTINAENSSTEENGAGTYNRQEFSDTSISGMFMLPEDIDEEKIRAKYKRGVLTIQLEKPGKSSKFKQKIEID